MSGYEIPKSMKARVLGDPDVLELVNKPVLKPETGEG